MTTTKTGDLPWRQRPLPEQVDYWRRFARHHEDTVRILRAKLEEAHHTIELLTREKETDQP